MADEIKQIVTRRDFIKSTSAAGLVLATSGCSTQMKTVHGVLGANDTVRIGIAGLRVKGGQHVDVFREMDHVQVAAICDVDDQMLARESAKFEADGESVKTFTDIRHMLDQEDIDAIVVASPNHWHSLMGIWACQAGKDVYVEKPVCHTVWEGRQLVNAAARYCRIVQAGIQKRSDGGLIEAFQYIREGHIGKITLARGFCYKRRKSIGLANGPQPIPKHIDYNLWTGPAELGPLMRKSLHYDWHWQWETGNGDIGNQGIHEVDLCRWVLGEKGYPKSIMSYGGRYGYVDDGETPNTQVIFYDYDSAPILFEVRGLPQSSKLEAMDTYKGIRIGVVIECENGYFAGGDGGGWVYDRQGKKIKQFVGTGGVKEHAANFIQAIRNRNTDILKGPIQEGHISSSLCHLGNISYRLGTVQDMAACQKALTHEDQRDALNRVQMHLNQNDVPIETQSIWFGPTLSFSDKKEQFISNALFDIPDFANGMLKGKYRHPFVVPQIT